MTRAFKRSCELRTLRERARGAPQRHRARRDLEALFGGGRAGAQSVMKGSGVFRLSAGTQFVERPALLPFAHYKPKEAARAKTD